jgi:23S rRNA (guanine745-N1)-methyltransferase
MLWCCPNCGMPLELGEGAWRCHNGHSFDLAKQGYANLLLPNQKRSKDPGDSKEMVQARRLFLQQGHYQPLMSAIAAVVQPYLRGQETPAVVDLGCGEGSYLAWLRAALPELRAPGAQLHGLDISKEAIRRAAGLLPEVSFCVASSYRIPLSDASIDLALQVFAPVSEAEVQRVSKPQGLWLRVSPGPRHLHQIKAMLYSEVREHEEPSIPPGFALREQVRQEFQLHLKGSTTIAGLLSMTPFAWHGSKEGQQALQQCAELTVDADFITQLMACESAHADA